VHGGVLEKDENMFGAIGCLAHESLVSGADRGNDTDPDTVTPLDRAHGTAKRRDSHQ